MNNNCIMRTFELVDRMDSFSQPCMVKPMNTRTRKTTWKERRRMANLPRSIKKRVGKR